MPRINTRKVELNEVPRFCPNCGAANSAAGLRCTICGHRFATPDTEAGLWGPNAQNQKDGSDDFDGMYAGAPTTISTIPDYQDEPAASVEQTRPFTPVGDPWASSGGRLGASPESGKAFVPPIPGAEKQRKSGPPGWLLGIAGLLLIVGVAAVAAWFIGRPMFSDEVADNAIAGVNQALAEVTVVVPPGTDTLVVSESDVNRMIRANSEQFEPVQDVRVQIRRSGIETSLNVYGVSANLSGTVDVEDGKIVIVNPELSGIANRLIDIDTFVPRVEDAINGLLAQNGLEATDVTLTDDTMTIEVQPVSP